LGLVGAKWPLHGFVHQTLAPLLDMGMAASATLHLSINFWAGQEGELLILHVLAAAGIDREDQPGFTCQLLSHIVPYWKQPPGARNHSVMGCFGGD
jgi:hypothetical protein